MAKQIWICGYDILRSTIPNFWKGRCARVQAVMEIVLLPSLKNIDTSLGDNDISRQKRAYTPDPLVKIGSTRRGEVILFGFWDLVFGT